jgi:hypothetical protein
MNSREMQHAPGVRRYSLTNERGAGQRTSEVARDEVLLYLLKREDASREDIGEDLAARCESREVVFRAVKWLTRARDIEQSSVPGNRWRLTEAGRAKAVELQAARAARRAA